MYVTKVLLILSLLKSCHLLSIYLWDNNLTAFMHQPASESSLYWKSKDATVCGNGNGYLPWGWLSLPSGHFPVGWATPSLACLDQWSFQTGPVRCFPPLVNCSWDWESGAGLTQSLFSTKKVNTHEQWMTYSAKWLEEQRQPLADWVRRCQRGAEMGDGGGSWGG